MSGALLSGFACVGLFLAQALIETNRNVQAAVNWLIANCA